ncbi:MAG: flagellar basal-body MS-ring/collar protein FliF [Acidobacteriota bacterium]|nr:flagellar basal-body MS-ring/collar protein FliF [Acidobacteriota bacterium]
MSSPASLGQITTQLRDFAASLTARQKLLLAGGVVVVAAVLFAFVHLLAKPEMTPLYSNMEPADAQDLGQRLTAKNIRFQLSPDGRNVLVASDQLDTARLELANNGTPHSGRMGFELFDKTNWATSDFDDRVNYQRALEGELERTIQAMNGVAGVRVHLVMPPDSIYSGQERQAKAAVIVKPKGPRIPLAMKQAIQRLVASAVDKLDPQNVSVVDADAGSGSLAASSQPTGEEHTADQQMADLLLHTLEPVIGPDHIRATVHTEVDQGTVEENSETYDPDSTVTLTMQRSEETNGGTAGGGAAGTASNVPGGGTPAKTSDGNFSQSKSENGTYAFNKVQRHTVQPPGRMKRLAVAVLVDDIVNPLNKQNPRMKRSPDEMKSIEELAKAAVGFDATRGDVISVQNISFQDLPVETPAAPTKWQKVRTTVLQWTSYVRILAMLLIFAVTYLFVLRPVKKQMVLALAAHKPGVGRLAGAGADGGSLSEGDPALQAEATQMARLKTDISDHVQREPASATRLVQSWLKQGTR